MVDPGNIVHASDTTGIVIINQLRPIAVLFSIAEDRLPQVLSRMKDGLAVEAWSRDRKVKYATGRLTAVDNQIDTATGTVKLKAVFDNKDGALFPNQFVNVRLLLDTHKDVTTMPTAGVQHGVPGTFVYLVNADNTVSVRKVVLGVTDGDRVEVTSGLVPGDRIVIDGADKLRDGSKINVRSETNPGAAPSGTAPAGSDKSGGKKRRSDSGQKQ